jgi:hypothetical protein
MIFPTIHLNGTHPDTLSEAYQKASDAVFTAIEALRNTEPNMRDYYPQEAPNFERALLEHHDRVQQLERVRSELLALWADVLDQQERKSQS